MINELSLNNSESEILGRNSSNSLGQCCGFEFLFSLLTIKVLIFMQRTSLSPGPTAVWAFQQPDTKWKLVDIVVNLKIKRK